jgi:predicted nucleic acid-binding protein
VADLAGLRADHYPLLPFMAPAYELRANLSPYEATDVALAEHLGCRLLTAEARLARAHGPRCPIVLLWAA